MRQDVVERSRTLKTRMGYGEGLRGVQSQKWGHLLAELLTSSATTLLPIEMACNSTVTLAT